MNFLTLLEAKRDGHALDAGQISWIIADYTRGQIPDYQMAAFLMAIYFKGLTQNETWALTAAMRDSGDVLTWPADPRPLVDKHSTGGVGDKVSLPLAPLLACLGFRVPMISGRGLGITGGTLDKLDSIPGFQTTLQVERIQEIVHDVGCVICGQTPRMVPADKALYSLRDVTGTVPSIPLIVASIMSKKLAEGLNALVLDVKFGSAAFMPTLDKARELAQAMVHLGARSGLRTRALLTSMDAPLGRAAGNWLEVLESVHCLRPPTPGHPAPPDDLRQLVLECAAHLLVQSGKEAAIESARLRAAQTLDSGEPLAKWEAMLAAQGANLHAFQEKLAAPSSTPVTRLFTSAESGFVSRCDARILGEVIRDLGGGRLHKESQIHYEVGVDQILKPGEPVTRGQPLARLHAATQTQSDRAVERLQTAFAVEPEPPPLPDLIAEVIEQN